MRFRVYFATIVAFVSVNCMGQIKPSDANAQSSPVMLGKMPEELEVRYAVSALPPHLRDGATIYILDPNRGYALHVQGTNGMTCIVVRSDWQFPKHAFRDDIYWPVCYDAEGSKTLLQDYLYTAELRAHGMESNQTHEEVVKRFGKPSYPNPSRTGIAYMLAPIMRTFGDAKTPEPMTMNLPHYMFYAPNVKNADIGGKSFSEYPFILSMSPGRDDVIILFAGEAEKAKILLDSKDLLADLCSYRDLLCTTDASRMQKPNN